MSKPFALLISAHRKRLGLTQPAAAALFHGLSLRTWQDWEYGERTPPEWSQRLILERLEKQKTTNGPE